MRSVGNDSDISISTIALFGGRGYTFRMRQFSSDVPSFGDFIGALIITPPGLATFYNETNYKGKSVCFKPAIGSETHYQTAGLRVKTSFYC